MNKTFEAIKKTEQDGSAIVRKAKEQAIDINEKLSEDIHAMEHDYNAKINDLKNQLSLQDTEKLKQQQAQMDKAFTKEKDRITSLFSTQKEEWRCTLIRKVMNANGHSSN